MRVRSAVGSSFIAGAVLAALIGSRASGAEVGIIVAPGGSSPVIVRPDPSMAPYGRVMDQRPGLFLQQKGLEPGVELRSSAQDPVLLERRVPVQPDEVVARFLRSDPGDARNATTASPAPEPPFDFSGLEGVMAQRRVYVTGINYGGRSSRYNVGPAFAGWGAAGYAGTRGSSARWSAELDQWITALRVMGSGAL